MGPRNILSVAPILFALMLGSGSPTSELRFVEVRSPAGAGSQSANLASLKGRAYLTWLVGMPNWQHVLHLSSWDGRDWSPPRPAVSGSALLLNWADFPSILPLTDGSLALHWLHRTGPHTYDILVSRSSDGGGSWPPGVRPHRDGTETEHGFVSLVEYPSGRFGAVWLDGRSMASQTNGASHGGVALMFSSWEDGNFGPEVTLDRTVCECCQTSATATRNGIFVAYRDRSDSEVRDISYVRLVDGNWSEPRTLCRDGWKIPGCPVNGPAVAAQGDDVAVAWFTISTMPRVQVIFSSDGGATFGDPVRVDQGVPAGRVDIEWLPDGAVLISWLENLGGQNAEVRARKVRPDGAMGSPLTVAKTTAARTSGFPRMARAGAEVLIAWADFSSTTGIRVGRIIP
jgi:hypothetical protein